MTRTAPLSDSITKAEPDHGTSMPQAPLRLLHVEDNPADALLMQEYIRGILADVEFDCAQRLSDLSPLRASSAHCAILDLSLPDATGLEALIALRRMSEELPIIVLTGFDDLEVGLSALRYGADDYLVKNHVDGVTLDRAVRYAIERRRLKVDAEREAAATTVALADVIKAEATLQAEMLDRQLSGSAGADSSTPALDTLVGTHQVAVRIDANTGEYALSCDSCEWEADRGDDEQHSWADRSLDWILLRHVAFGDLPDAARTVPTPVERPALAADLAAAQEPLSSTCEETVERRRLLRPQEWLQPQAAPEAAERPEG